MMHRHEVITIVVLRHVGHSAEAYVYVSRDCVEDVHQAVGMASVDSPTWGGSARVQYM